MKNRKTMGDFNEKLASEFLMKHGFSIIYKNYRKVFGEIDIIAEKNSVIHFVEVKSVSRETLNKGIKPEDHVTDQKIKKISRTAQHFLTENQLYDIGCQIDLITILSDESRNSNNFDKLIDINYFEKIY